MRAIVRTTLVLALVSCQPVIAGTRHLLIGEVPLELGMAGDKALALLGEKYNLRPLGEGDYIVLQPSPPDVIGTITVVANRITRLSRNWADGTKEPSLKLAQAVWDVIANAAGEGTSTAVVHTRTSRSPEGTFFDLQLVFPDRRISLTFSDRSLTLSETLEERSR